MRLPAIVLSVVVVAAVRVHAAPPPEPDVSPASAPVAVLVTGELRAGAATALRTADPIPAAPVVVAPDPVPAPDVPDQGLVVTGTRTPRRVTDDPVGTERIGARELAARNVHDASRALDGEPGIQSERSFRGSSFQVRGLEAKYVRILVDGQPVMGQVNDVIDLRRYATEAVERIEFVRGASSALYGSDALAGVVNFISRRPKRALEAGGFLQYGMLNQSLLGATVGTKQGNWAGTLSLNWFGNNSYDLTPTDENLSTNGDARKALNATARAFWTPSDDLEVMLWARGGSFDSRGVDLQPPRALFNRQVGETEGALGAQLTRKISEATRLVANLQGNAFARDFTQKQRQGNQSNPNESFETLARGEVQVDHELRKGTELSLGVGGHRAGFDSQRIDAGTALVHSGWTYLQAALDLGERVNLVIGGRVDFDGQFGVHPTPRLAARVKLDSILEGLGLRAGYGQGFRAPSFGERYMNWRNPVANYTIKGNPDLQPETSHNLQAGLEWTPKAFTVGGLLPTARLTGFYNALDGLIQPVVVSGNVMSNMEIAYRNYSTARVAGVETSVRFTRGDWLIADLGYAWLDTRATLEGKTRALPGRAGRQLTAGLVLADEASGLEFTVRPQLLMNRSALADDTVLQPVLLADARLAKRLWKALKGRSEVQAYLMGENLADVQEPEFLSLPGRLVSVGFSARY